MKRTFDGREHRIKTKCPECGYISAIRIQWSEQGGTCSECRCAFPILMNEIKPIEIYDAAEYGIVVHLYADNTVQQIDECGEIIETIKCTSPEKAKAAFEKIVHFLIK